MVAGSHHSPESFVIYIKNRENTKKILATSEDRTPTVAEKCLSTRFLFIAAYLYIYNI